MMLYANAAPHVERIAGNESSTVSSVLRPKRQIACIVSGLFCSMLIVLPGCGTGVDIWQAIDRDDLNAITTYVERGGDLDAGADLYGKTPLLYAYMNAKQASYDKLLELGANPNTLCARGRTVMHSASADADSHWLEQALKHKGDPNLENTNASDVHRGTPLWLAIGSNRLKNVQLLHEQGADLDRDVHYFKSPFAFACYSSRFQIALYLLKAGADPFKPAGITETGIYLIQEKIRVSKGNPPPYPKDELRCLDEIVEIVKKKGIDPEKAEWMVDHWQNPGQ